MNTIYNEIKEEFGSSALSASYPQPALSITQAQYLLHKYGMEKGIAIGKRYQALCTKVGA